MKYRIPDQVNLAREDCETLDAGDPLAIWRDRFSLPPGVTYFDGMSLGPLPKSASSKVNKVVDQEWGEGLIRSWNTAGWIESSTRLGSKLAPLMGVDGEEVVVADSTSVNLFKLLVAALRLRPDRNVILLETSNFPTDIYVARGVEALCPGADVRLVSEVELEASFDQDVAVALLTHIDFKTARMHDMAAVTKRAHEVGALVLWDLSHSIGAVPLDLHDCNADLATGCGYKYLNGGPGAPAFMFVAKRHLGTIDQPIHAWMGHDKPFEFSIDYVPATGINRLLSGTPMIVSMAALEAGIDLWLDIDLSMVREKSKAMSELFIRIVESRVGDSAMTLASPKNPDQRGSHLAFQYAHGYEVIQALIDKEIIGDFRAPDLMRFGFTPLYTRFTDVWYAANALSEVIESGTWNNPEYRRRAAVT